MMLPEYTPCGGKSQEVPYVPRGAPGFLLRYAAHHRLWISLLLAIVVSGAIAAVAAQYGLRLLVDAMTAPGRDLAAVARALGLFLGLLALENVCWRIGGFVGAHSVIAVSEDIRVDLFAVVSARSWDFFSTQASGALAGRITGAAEAAAAVLRTIVWNILPPATDVVGSVVVLSLINWQLGAALIAAAAPATFLLHWLGRRGFRLHEAYYREAAETSGTLADTLINMSIVHAFGSRASEQSRLRCRIRREGLAHFASWGFLERLRCAHDLAFWLVNAAVMSASVMLWSRDAISTGGVVVATTLTLRVVAGSRELGLSLLGLSQQLGAVTEAVGVLVEPAAESRDTPGLGIDTPGLGIQVREGTIELRAVRFAPSPGETLFAGFDLHVPAGQRVGIVGPSGAGKSTLLRLISGIVPPQAGLVLLDGQPLSGEAPPDIFSVVPQDPALFQRSILDNLRYGCNGASWREVLAVAEAVGCHRFVRGLPHGYETMVGERGVRLSGGQRQRIAVARALLHQGRVLLLDEATSALDSAAEREVQSALTNFAGDRTIVAVAHRLSTVMDFDRVVVLEAGRIIEDGSPVELRRGNGYFAKTLRLQRGEPEDAVAVSCE